MPDASAPAPKKAAKPKATMGVHVNGVPLPKSKSSKKDASKSKSATKSKNSPKKPAPKEITQEQVAEMSDSELSDDDIATRDIQTKLPGNEKAKEASSDSDSASESSSDSSSDDSDTDDAPQPTQRPAQQQPQSQSQSHAVEFRPSGPYVPPKGFNLVPLNDKTVSKTAGLFDNLQGKEIWHITAPAGVSLKDLSKVDMDKAMGGEAVLSYKGTDYGLVKTEKSEDGTRDIFVPRKNGLDPVAARISHTLRLRTVVRLPQLSSKQANQNTGSEAAASITRSTIRAPRPQLTGLKMRFLPTGFSGSEGGILGDSDDEAEAPREPAGLGMPGGIHPPARKHKRKHADLNGADAAEAPAKKTKKDRNPDELKKKEERRAKKEKKRAKEAASVES
jgi:hypothetical protein